MECPHCGKERPDTLYTSKFDSYLNRPEDPLQQAIDDEVRKLRT